MTDIAVNKLEVYTLLAEFAGAILLDTPASDPAKCEGALSRIRGQSVQEYSSGKLR